MLHDETKAADRYDTTTRRGVGGYDTIRYDGGSINVRRGDDEGGERPSEPVAQRREGPGARREEYLGEQIITDARRLLLVHEKDRQLFLGAFLGRGGEQRPELLCKARRVAVLEPGQAERRKLGLEEARVKNSLEGPEIPQIIVPQRHRAVVRRESQREARVRVARAQTPPAAHAERRPERHAVF